jgi:serine/threonine-protein kinase
LEHGQEQPSGPPDIIGRTLGSYRVERLLGSGGMGQVFLAVQPEIGSRVAVKVLSLDCARKRSLVERFFNEARAVNVIRHEGIVNVLDLSTLPDGRPYIIMEFVDGTSMADLIRSGPLPLDRLTSLALQTLEALQATHAKQVVHRDLKPENLMVTRGGRLKVLDFGIAKLVPEGAPVTGLTQSGMVLGTPAYMAPEQILGERVDSRTDIYAMGVILFEGATGHKPFFGKTLYELFDRQLSSPPPPPGTLRPDLPPGFEAVILQALAKRPDHRFQSARAMAGALQAVAAGHGTLALLPRHTPVRTASPSAVTGTLQPRPGPGAADPTLPPATGPGVDATLPPGPGVADPTLPPATGPGVDATLPPATGPVAPPSAAPGPAPGTTVGPGALPVTGPTHGPARPSRLWLWLLVAGLVVIGGMTAAGVVALRSCVSAITTGGALNPAASTETPLVISLGVHRPDYDPEHFRPLEYFERARAAARKVADDMQLMMFQVDGVYPDGHADLTLRSNYNAIYTFRSPSLSRGDPSKPANIKQRIHCLVTVLARAQDVRIVQGISGRDCAEELLPPWRCTIAQAYARARDGTHDAGLPPGNNIVATAIWEKGGWSLNFDRLGSVYVTGDCRGIRQP